MVKSRRMRYEKPAVGMGKNKILYRAFLVEFKRKKCGHLENPSVDGKIILK